MNKQIYVEALALDNLKYFSFICPFTYKYTNFINKSQ